MTQMIIFFLITITFLGFNSCKKEKNESGYQDSTLLMQVKSGDYTLEQLTYLGAGKVNDHVESFSYTKYSYNSQDQLIKLERAFSTNPLSCFMPSGSNGEIITDPRKAKVTQYSEYEYNNSGRLAKRSNYNLGSENFQLVSYLTYDYDNNLITKLNYYNPQGQLVQYEAYTYDSNNNVTRDDYYTVEAGANAQLHHYNSYEFDDKKNPYKVFAMEGTPGIFTNQNNITKDIYVYVYNGTEYRNPTAYTYEYNLLGYPTKINGKNYVYGE